MNAGFVQFGPRFGEKEGNVRTVVEMLDGREFDLIVLPELFNTGYQFASHGEVAELAEVVPGGFTTSALISFARKKQSYIVFGMLEECDGRYYNSAVLVGPEGYMGTYRKTHLFFEEKIWFSPGDTGFLVWNTKIGKIGIMVCFDWFYPESARTLSLKGAEIIAHPSNLVLPYCPDSMPVRCLENGIYAITANRTGTEERQPGKPALNFIGSSQITGPDGRILIRAAKTDDQIGIQQIDLTLARNKEINQYNDLFRDRRPEMYM